MQLTDGYFSGTSLNVSDGVVAVVKATNTGNQSHSITLVTEGSQHYSYVVSTIPFNAGISNYTTGGTYNQSTGVLTFTRTDGNTYTAGTFNYLTGSSQSGNVLTLTTNTGQTFTYTPIAITGGTYSNGAITFGGSGGINTTITGLPQGTITAVTESNNTVTVESNSSSTTFVIDAVTGGTYSNGTITLGGSGNINTTITGIPTGSTSSGGGTVWYGADTSVTAATNTGYITTATTLSTITLPTTAPLGFSFEVVGNGTGLWRINQNTGQTIRFGIVSATTTTGIISATTQYDAIRLVCTTANTEFTVFSALGNLFYN